MLIVFTKGSERQTCILRNDMILCVVTLNFIRKVCAQMHDASESVGSLVKAIIRLVKSSQLNV